MEEFMNGLFKSEPKHSSSFSILSNNIDDNDDHENDDKRIKSITKNFHVFYDGINKLIKTQR